MKYKFSSFLLLIIGVLLAITAVSCAQPNYYESDLLTACENSDYSLMKKCLKNGVSPNFRIKETVSSENLKKIGGNVSSEYECYLLHSVILKSDYKALKILLEYNASNLVKDSYSNTPLHIAIKLQDYRAFKLLKPELVANNVDNLGNTPLLVAIKLNDSKLYNRLIDIEGIPEWQNYVNCQNYAGESALMIAAENKNRDLEKKLLKKEIDINLQDKDGNSLLMRSVIKQDVDEINFLLMNGANVNILNIDKKNALALAAENGNKEISNILLNSNINVNNANAEGKSALMTAVEKNDLDLVSDLLSANSNVNIQDNNGNSALILAVKNNNSNIVETLLLNKADPNLVDIDGKSSLFYSLSNSNYEISEQLIKYFADVDINTSDGVSFVKYFIESNNTKFAKLLIDNNANLDFYDEYGRGPLQMAFEQNNPEIIESLVARNIDVDVIDRNGKNILLSAIDNNDLRIVKSLLFGGANPNMLYDSTPLILKAINESNIELVKLLVEAQADVNIIDNEDKMLLLTAVLQNNTDLSLVLIRGGAKGHICDLNQRYLMDIALTNGNKTICKALFDCPDSSEIINCEGKSFLVDVVKNSELESLVKLLSLGMNPDETDKDGNSLLTIAINNNDLESVKILVLHGADSSIENNIGRSSRDYLKKASIKIKYEVGKTIYHYTDGEIRLILTIIIILILAFIIYKIIEHKKVVEKWNLETQLRNDNNKKVSKKANTKENEPRKVFRVIQLFDQFSTLPIPEEENQIFNFLMISLLRILNPFVITRSIFKDLFEKQYVIQVTEKYHIEGFDLSRNILKAKLKVLNKYKKQGKDLRFDILIYIYLLYLFLGFKMLPDEYKLITSYLGYSNPNNKKRILKIMKKVENIYNDNKQADILEFVEIQEKYLHEKSFNIAVCATMSSGKSTFINALLGNDCLPARNEATTAIITSVYDFDGMNKTIGYATRSDIPSDISNITTLEKMNEWNDSSDSYNHIYLQGDFDYISCGNSISVIHDTPGTNNSGDKTHHDITMDFLTSNKFDAIVFVVNAEHVATTDEKFLLSEIYKNKISKNKTPIIFALNKADCVDNEKEDINSIIEKYKIYLNEIGFENPKVYPVSAKAARLMKMAVKNKANNFSKMEQREFALSLSEFLEDFDFSNLQEDFSKFDDMLKIGQKEYPKKDVLTALNRTGINAIEKEIESLL